MYGQEIRADSINYIYENYNKKYLLNDLNVQFEITDDIDNMYNFNFEVAKVGFIYIGRIYPKHPLSDFLMALLYYWQARPNLNDDQFDDDIMKYADLAIEKGEEIVEEDDENAEVLFLMSASYALKGRIHGERHNWSRAIYYSKKSLNFFDEASKLNHFSPEILFGEGLYDYYVVWLKEHYSMLKPVIAVFKDGDKKRGLDKLQRASLNAFYTRVEAKLFVVRILSSTDEAKYEEALMTVKPLHAKYPNNPIFHQYYARLLYFTNDYDNTKDVCLKMLDAIDSRKPGYGATAGRYAAFFLGQVYQSQKNYEEAKKFYLKAIKYSEEGDATSAGYCIYAYISLGDIAKKDKKYDISASYYKQAKKLANRGGQGFIAAKKKLKMRSAVF